MADGDDDKLMSVNEGTVPDIPVDWRDVPTVLVDSVVGYVSVAGIPRITLGQIVHTPGKSVPKYLPVLAIAGAPEALEFMSKQIAEIAQLATKGEADEPTED